MMVDRLCHVAISNPRPGDSCLAPVFRARGGEAWVRSARVSECGGLGWCTEYKYYVKTRIHMGHSRTGVSGRCVA